MVYVKVKDTDSVVQGVYKVDPGPQSGHTIYNENYNKDLCWNDTVSPIVRNGIGDYS